MPPPLEPGAHGGISQASRANIPNFAHITHDTHRGEVPGVEPAAVLFDVPYNGKRRRVATITRVITTALATAGGVVGIVEQMGHHANKGDVKATTKK